MKGDVVDKLYILSLRAETKKNSRKHDRQSAKIISGDSEVYLFGHKNKNPDRIEMVFVFEL